MTDASHLPLETEESLEAPPLADTFPPAPSSTVDSHTLLAQLLNACHRSVLPEDVFDALGELLLPALNATHMQLVLLDSTKQASIRRICYEGDGFAHIENDFNRHHDADPLLQTLNLPLFEQAWPFHPRFKADAPPTDAAEGVIHARTEALPASVCLPTLAGVHLILPLYCKQELLGVWTISRCQPLHPRTQPFETSYQELAKHVAPLLALQLDQLRLLSEGQRLITKQYALAQLNIKLRESLEEAQLVNTTCQELAQLFGVQRVGLVLFSEPIALNLLPSPLETSTHGDPSHTETLLAPFFPPPEADPQQVHAYHYNYQHTKHDAFVQHVTFATFYHTLLMETLKFRGAGWQCHSQYQKGVQHSVLTPFHVQAMATVPLQSRQGVLGLLCCFDTERPRHWVKEDQALLEGIAEHFSIALTQARLIHDLQQKNQTLATTLAELQTAQVQLVQHEKMAVIGQFTAGIAHDVNTPLGSMLSNQQTLKTVFDRIEAQPERTSELVTLGQNLLSVSQMAGERIMETVKNLRNFSRLDENELKTVDIHEGLDSTLLLLRSVLPKHIDIQRHYDRRLPPLRCFPGLLNQVFMNMIVNASHALEHQHPAVIHIHTTATEAGELRISIADNGKGIAPEHLEKLFDPGFTTKGRGVGTGLGLALCYKIIEKHQGRIEVESQLGEGASFHIFLAMN